MTSPFDPRAFLASLFRAAVAAADPLLVMPAFLPEKPKGRTIVVGAGKAASQMAAALEALWDGPLTGTVVARHGPVAPTRHIRVLQAAHPVPDAAGLAASEALLAQVRGLGPDDLVIALISGGGSALLPAPAPGLTLADEVAVNRALLASGAPISAMNTIRTAISRIKGGRLALASAPARVVSLVVSDVPGDEAWQVASGPTVPGPQGDPLAVIRQWNLTLPEPVLNTIRHTKLPQTTDPAFTRNQTHIIASARLSLQAAARAAGAAGVEAVILSDRVEGEARLVGQADAGRAAAWPGNRPIVLLSGGETTVTIGEGPPGKGGRNTEYLLGFTLAMQGQNWHALAADTDGIDGSEDNAGAFADATSLTRMRDINPAACLARHDSHKAFAAASDLFTTGPTGTNVNDFRAVLLA